MLHFLRKRWYLVFMFFFLASAGYYFKAVVQAKTNATKKTYTVKKDTVKDELSLSGEIDAEEHVILRFQSSGKLSWVGVKEGDYIKKYQSIASIDQREVQQNLKKYLNTYAKTRSDFDQNIEDNQIKNIGSLSEDARREAIRVFEKSQNDLNNAVIDVELRNLAIEYSSIYSPIEGIVIRVGSPYAGVNVTPSQAEFEIVNPKTIFFSVAADQTDVVKLKEGAKGIIILDAYPNKQIEGVVKKISFVPKSGETGTVYEVRMYFNKDNSINRFRLGMTGDVNFTLSEEKNVLTVPTSYIKSSLPNKNNVEEKFVWKLQGNKRMKTIVTVGDEIDGSTVIKSGLQEGDAIEN